MNFWEEMELLLIKVGLEAQAKRLENEIRVVCEKCGIVADIDFKLEVQSVDLDEFRKAMQTMENDDKDTADIFNTITKTYKE